MRERAIYIRWETGERLNGFNRNPGKSTPTWGFDDAETINIYFVDEDMTAKELTDPWVVGFMIKEAPYFDTAPLIYQNVFSEATDDDGNTYYTKTFDMSSDSLALLLGRGEDVFGDDKSSVDLHCSIQVTTAGTSTMTSASFGCKIHNNLWRSSGEATTLPIDTTLTGISEGTVVWADDAARALKVPVFEGQYGTQLDTSETWVSYGTLAGEWRRTSGEVTVTTAAQLTSALASGIESIVVTGAITGVDFTTSARVHIRGVAGGSITGATDTLTINHAESLVEDLSITSGTNNAIGIGINASGTVIRNCQIDGAGGYGVNVIRTSQTADIRRIRVEGCEFDGSGGLNEGVYSRDPLGANYVYTAEIAVLNCHFFDLDRSAVYVDRGNDVLIDGNTAERCGDIGTGRTAFKTNNPVGKSRIVNNRAIDSVSMGIEVWQYTEAVIANNHVIGAGEQGISLEGGTDSRATVTGNIVEDVNGAALEVFGRSGTNYVTVSGNTLKGVVSTIQYPLTVSVKNVRNVVLDNNIIHDCPIAEYTGSTSGRTSRSVQIEDCDNVKFSNNLIKNPGDVAIKLESATNVHVTDNLITYSGPVRQVFNLQGHDVTGNRSRYWVQRNKIIKDIRTGAVKHDASAATNGTALLIVPSEYESSGFYLYATLESNNANGSDSRFSITNDLATGNYIAVTHNAGSPTSGAVQLYYTEVGADTTADTAWNVAGNVNSTAHGFGTGMEVLLTSDGTEPTFTTSIESYQQYLYIIRIDADNYKLATSWDNAIAGTANEITGAGSGNHTLTPQDHRRFLHAHATVQKRWLYIQATDGTTIEASYDANAATNGVPVYFDDDAANEYERLLFVSPSAADGTYLNSANKNFYTQSFLYQHKYCVGYFDRKQTGLGDIPDSVTQTTSITTGVETTTMTGTITTVSLTTAANSSESAFTVSNRNIKADDIVSVSIKNYSGTGTPLLTVTDVSDSSFDICVANVSGSAALNSTITLSYQAVRKFDYVATGSGPFTLGEKQYMGSNEVRVVKSAYP